MSAKISLEGYLGKDPYVQTITDKKVVVLSIAVRRGSSRHCDWITGTIWDERLQIFVLGQFKKGDKIQATGIMGRITVYHSGSGKANGTMDVFLNTIGFANHIAKERSE